MHDDREPIEYTDEERAMFAVLPRESAPNALSEHRLVHALRAEGYFRPRMRRAVWFAAAAAAGVALLIAAGAAGYRYGMRNSLEHRLAETTLSLNDRVLLLQRAGSAY